MTDPTPVGDLTDVEAEILEFERLWWKYEGAKVATVRERFGMTDTRYYQVLNALIDRPEALAHDAQLVGRLQRIRDGRRRQRTARAVRT